MRLEHFNNLLAVLCRSPHEELAHAETTVLRVYHFREEFLAAVVGEGRFGQSVEKGLTAGALFEHFPPRLFAISCRVERTQLGKVLP